MNDEELEARLRQALRPERIPPAQATWGRLRDRAAAPGGSPSRRRALRALVGAAAVVLATAGLAFAGSPALRQQVAQAVGIAGVGGRVLSLSPAPPFAVLQPAALPAGMQLLAQGYNPNTASGAPRPIAVGGMARPAGAAGDPRLAQIAGAEATRLLQRGGPALALVYADAAGRLVALVERPDGGAPPPAGEAVAIGQARGVLARDGEDTVLTWAERGTRLELRGSAGREELLRLAASLRVSRLGGLPGGPPPATPPPAPRERAAATAVPTAPAADLARRCGVWAPAAAGQLSPETAQRAHCIAQALTGDTASSSAGESLVPWQEAARQWGIDPSSGPAGDPLVLVVELGDQRGVGRWLAVLDPGTGRPYVTAQLRPVP